VLFKGIPTLEVQTLKQLLFESSHMLEVQPYTNTGGTSLRWWYWRHWPLLKPTALSSCITVTSQVAYE